MAQFDLQNHALVGAGGLLSVRADDEVTRKLSMLIEGECEGLERFRFLCSTPLDGIAPKCCGFLRPPQGAAATQKQTLL